MEFSAALTQGLKLRSLLIGALIFGSKNPNFWTFLGVLGVKMDWDMCPDIYLSPMDHFQALLGFVFIIFNNLTIFPLLPSMDFRGA